MTDETPRQLAMLPDLPSGPRPAGAWRLDGATRARGLRGVEAARQALAEAAARRAEALDRAHGREAA